VAKDKKGLKVPKRIAGLKVPKEIRKPVNKALKLAEDPKARGLAIAALTAAATALAAPPGEAAVQRPRKPGEPGTDNRAGTLAEMVIAAALDGARRLLDGLETPAATPAAEDKPAAKPKRSRASARAAPAAGPADA
jgi:hypothetical protein